MCTWNDQAKEIASRSCAHTCEVLGKDGNVWGRSGNTLTDTDRQEICKAIKGESGGFQIQGEEGRYVVVRKDEDGKKKVLVAKKKQCSVLAADYPDGTVISVIDDPDNKLPVLRNNFEVIGDYYSQFFK